MLGPAAATPAEAVASYAAAVERLRDAVHIEPTFAAMGVEEKDFVSALPQQALNAFDDQCAPANPHVPMLDDMQELMLAAYHGTAPGAHGGARHEEDHHEPSGALSGPIGPAGRGPGPATIDMTTPDDDTTRGLPA